MPESEHSLRARYDRLGDQIDGPVLDAIVVHPRSRGILSLPGEYSTDRPVPCQNSHNGSELVFSVLVRPLPDTR